ncbi:LLM class flavin-dependent oxidoreductase [Saccharopolyspora pogona]|uniref:LLM class flavin-dependent oxidoreductase n=1 Tax=Saccharopolyspora pogona TaxID=333966 RepID=UPI001688FF79|nr:LLM class flavin-dependent oxidoreductase [Saccharopolyspora pogona]
MKSGIFHVPYMRPERTPREVFDYSVLIAREADQAGFSDFMIGEHATQAWESVPNPEIVIGACARETERIRFAPMAHLLGLHQPGSLAIQVGWLSQVLEGRYFLGVGPGAYPRDAILRGQPADLSEARPRRDEALQIMKKVWDRKSFHYEGKFFNGGFPAEEAASADGAEFHMMPDFSPWKGAENLEIAMTALSHNSSSMRYAGEQGFSPISFFGGLEVARSHWNMYAEGATSKGLPTDRNRLRMCRDIVVADTDKEAKKIAINGGLGHCWRQYLIPVYKQFNILNGYVDDSGTGIDPADVDMDFIAEHIWICGSPETVIAKIEKMQDDIGGFGQIVMNTHDYVEDPKPWIESMHRIAKEVVPKVRPAV